MRTAKEIYDRICWDPGLDRRSFWIGYDDHIAGLIELPFEAFVPGGDVPWHRIRRYRCGSEVVWDRTESIDRLSSVQRATALPTIDDVIAFCFADRTCWFKKDPAFDAEIRGRFQRLQEAISRGDCDEWLETRRGTVACVIVLDQFSRNMYRGTGRMFASDRQALAAARRALERGDDQALSADERSFLHMPFMHSEQLSDQEHSVALFADGPPEGLWYAERHREIIRRFGRFPHRNELLGRESTPEEIEFLKEPGSSF